MTSVVFQGPGIIHTVLLRVMDQMGIDVCLNGISLNEWGGGRDFLSMLVEGVAVPGLDHGDDLTLLLPLGDALWCVKKDIIDAAKGVTASKVPNIGTLLDKIMGHVSVSHNEETLHILRLLRPDIPVTYSWNNPRSITKLMERNGHDVLIPVMNPPGKGLDKPWVGYIFDVQHRTHPEFFSTETIAYRDEQFQRMLAEAKVVIVNSRAVRNELAMFFPHAETRFVTLPFTPKTPTVWFDAPAITDVQIRYGVPERYFIICNQFWAHKDYLTAFRALRDAIDLDTRMRDVHLVCTGSTADSRFPEYYPMLVQEIERMQLTKMVHILGHIPKQDQLALLNGSIAVVQPTLYEGGPGGGAVYDAMSYGIPVIASDIPINQEINEGDITFFHASQSQDLARRMVERLDIPSACPDKDALTELGRNRAMRLHMKLDEAMDLAIDYND